MPHWKAWQCSLFTGPTLTSMKDRIPENETSIPFTVYGSSTSFLPLCGSECIRHQASSQLAAHPPKPSQTSLLYIQGNPGSPTSQPPSTLCPLTALPSVQYCSLDLGHWKSSRRKKRMESDIQEAKEANLLLSTSIPWLPRIYPHLMFSLAPMAYLQHSSKTIQTITHSNIDGFPKDAVTMFWICNHLRVMRMSVKPQVCKEEYLALGKNIAEDQYGRCSFQ